MKVSVIGATGYTGVELVRLLAEHPEVEINALTSHSFAGEQIADIYPHLKEKLDIECEKLNVEQVAAASEVVFTALPHGVSMEVVPDFVEQGVTVIDLSGDYRYQKLATYEEWYQEHSSPDLLNSGIYGLPEINREEVRTSNLIANPGCYPTTSILALYPLVKEGLIDSQGIIIDAKSGVTGAGRKPTRGTHFCEVEENFKAYKVANHRHQSEIEERLTAWTPEKTEVTFTPHLLPVKRGILATIYGNLTNNLSEQDLISCYQDFYSGEEFVRILTDKTPQLKYVAGSNYCDLAVTVNDRGQVVVLAAIDNLIKGSAGQAVQNLNLVAGWEETTGLEKAGLYL